MRLHTMALPDLVTRCRVTDSWGRFVSPTVAEKYNLDPIPYQGIDQIVEVDKNGQKL